MRTKNQDDNCQQFITAAEASGFEKTTALAWETFVDTGRFPEKPPRAVITRSWELSRDLGINPHAERASTVLSLDEIQDRLQRESLGQAGVPAIEQLLQKFDHSEHVIVLADHDGCILHSAGHRHIQHHLETINFMPGAKWSEQSVGPNGIGTPLTLGRPEVVMGHEHYCKGWQPWVCYGAPILSSSGDKILGVVDITGPVQKAANDTIVLAVSVAQSIQYGLQALTMRRREYLRLFSKDIVNRWAEQAVLLIDEEGFIIDHNSRVTRYFKDDHLGILNRPLVELIPGIWDVVHTRINNNAYGEINIDIMGDFGIHRPIQIHVEPVSNKDQCYGAVLILTGNTVCRADARINKKESELQSKYNFDHILGQSDSLKKAIKLARAAASDPLESGVLLIGETGTGKELIAHSIHAESKRCREPFVVINCSALPKDLIESDLFGYVAGAFTGARREGMTGKFEVAQNGTLFLDEINSLDTGLQAKFLRVLDNKEITRLGSHDTIPVNVRVIAAANKDIYQELDEKQFRLDLYHRLSVIEVPIPALRDRGDDVIYLANHFLEEECWYANRSKLILTKEVIPYLKGYSWPGNIRELHNICLRWVLTVDSNTVITEHLPDKLLAALQSKRTGGEVPVNDNLKTHNDELIKQVLVQTEGNVSEAARILGINRTTIYRRKKKMLQ